MSSMEERLSAARWALERQLAWASAAEVKVGVVVTLQVAMLGGLGAAFSVATKKSTWAYGSAVACVIAAVVALFCAALAVYPNTRGPNSSLFFFAKIAGMAEADYSVKFAAATETELLQDLTAQIHRNAEIACVKHGWVSKAMMVSFMSAIPWLIAVGMLLLA